MKVGCVVVAAGRGERAGLGYNKVFYPLAGKSVLMRTLDALAAGGHIDICVPVLNACDFEAYEKLLPREGRPAFLLPPVQGGSTRARSVYAGLKALDADTDIVLVHDAARPFVTEEIITSVIKDAEIYASGVISAPVTDTVKQTDADGHVRTLDRAYLRSVQTPQAFNYKMLLDAYASGADDAAATDDAYLFEKAYGNVHLTEAAGTRDNIKLTVMEDFLAAEARFNYEYRTGTGYDVHRLIEGRRLVLCGECIPYEKGLLGHSDADVALHALMDAMLGAAALGDIGRLFPDTDARYEGISSLVLLEETNRAINKAGFTLENCDVTIVCQRPKLAPYIDRMRQNIAICLQTDVSRVSVKATTTERLGFEGEGAGISAQAAVLLKKVTQ